MSRTGRLLPVRRGLRVHWKSASIARLLPFLLSPTFAGTYIFGRTESVTNQAKRPNGQHARRRTPKDQWITIPGYYPAYTTLAEQERIRDQLRRNKFSSAAPAWPRSGALPGRSYVREMRRYPERV